MLISPWAQAEGDMPHQNIQRETQVNAAPAAAAAASRAALVGQELKTKFKPPWLDVKCRAPSTCYANQPLGAG